MLPILIIIALGSFIATSLSNVSIVWIYLGLAVGFSTLLLLISFTGLLDFSGGDAHHDGATIADAGSHDGSNLFIITPATFLTVGALFGSYGLITFFSLGFVPFRDYLSIILSALLTGFTYFYIIKILFTLLKPSGLVKSNIFLEGKEAEVFYDIPENGFGKINVKIDDKYEQLLARSADGSSISAGSIVKIKKSFGNYVIVEKI